MTNAATKDLSCALIERPGERAAKRARMTPHAEAIGDRLSNTNTAALALLRHGCLIEGIALNADRVRIRLHRAPPAHLFAEPPRSRCQRGDGGWVATLRWHDVDLEWPAEVRS